MAYTMAADTDQLEKLKSKMEEDSGAIKGNIEAIFSKATGMNEETWSGDGYETFKSGINAYSDAMNAVPQVMNDFGTAFGNISQEADTLITDVKSAMGNIQ